MAASDAWSTGPHSQGVVSGPRAGFWRRFAAALLDGILLGIVDLILLAVLRAPGYVLGIILSVAYFTFFEGGPRGQSPGKSALGIRVISIDTGGPIGYGRAFIRTIGKWVSAIVIYIGYLWMLWDREKQCWHDKFAADVVVPVSALPAPVGRGHRWIGGPSGAREPLAPGVPAGSQLAVTARSAHSLGSQLPWPRQPSWPLPPLSWFDPLPPSSWLIPAPPSIVSLPLPPSIVSLPS